MLHPRHRTLVAAMALAALAGAAVAPLVARPAAELLADAVDDDIAQLKELVKGGEANKIIAKITELEAKPDSRYANEFAEIARKPGVDDRVAKTAMKAAAQKKHAELFKWLKGRLDDKKMIKEHPEKYIGVLDSLAFYGDKAAAEDLADVVKKHLATNSEISKRAIAAYGAIKQPAVVEQLILWLVQTESTAAGSGGGGGGSGGGGGGISPETKKNYGDAKQALLKTLKTLTQEDMEDAASWQKWWKDHEKGYVFPDTNAAEIDYATLKEYTDRAYGFTIKKAEEKFWAFKKNEEGGGRLLIDYRDDSGLEWARARVFTWKGNKEITNVEQFAKWWESGFRDKEFEKFGTGGEPKIETKKIGGRDFSVISARGLGKDSIKAWESCERRAYVTQATPTLFLYIECTMRAGAEEPLKASFWKMFDQMTFKN